MINLNLKVNETYLIVRALRVLAVELADSNSEQAIAITKLRREILEHVEL
jgi:hypothetical protein